MRALVLLALLAVACREPSPPAELRIDLGAPGWCRGEHAPAPGAGPSLVQAAPGTIDCWLRPPAQAKLIVGLDAGVPADAVAVSVTTDEGGEVVLPLVRRGDEWQGALDAFAGTPIRLRLQSRVPGALTWRAPRVVGVPAPRPPVLGVEARPPTAPVNVVLYVVDALRADHLGAYGYERPTSPNLDALARTGVLFLNAFSAGPNTMASIPSLLSSRYPWELGGHLRPSPGVPARPLAEVFHAAGYRTAAFQANFLLSGALGLQRGFDTYEVVRDLTPAGPRRATAAVLHARALAWLREPHDKPFFLYLQSLDVHDPYDPPPPFRGRFGAPAPGAVPATPPPLPGDPQLAPAVRQAIESLGERLNSERYDDSVAYNDHEIGTLLDALEDLGVRDHTVVVVTADHGESLGEDGRYLHGHSLIEELLHVPLIVALPWMASPLRVEEVVSLVDVAPTLLDVAGIAIPPEYLGRSLLRPYTGTDPPVAMGSRLSGLGGAKAEVVESYVRDGPWKLRTDPERARLFDVPSDAGERHDVSRERPVRTAYLASLLWRASRHGDAGGRARQLTSELGEGERQELERSLRALGYIE